MHDPGAAGIILDSFSIDEVRQATYDLIGRGNEKVEPGKKMTYTPRTKQVLELSAREAMELKMNYVGTEHVLLALMREPECVAAHCAGRAGPQPAGVAREADKVAARILAAEEGRHAQAQFSTAPT